MPDLRSRSEQDILLHLQQIIDCPSDQDASRLIEDFIFELKAVDKLHHGDIDAALPELAKRLANRYKEEPESSP